MGLWSGCVEDFMDVLGIFVESDPTWFSWILACLLQWLPLVPGDSVRFQRFRSCFFLHGIKPWILSWPSIWVETTLSPKPFDQNVLLARSRALAPFLRIWDRSKSAGAPGSHPQSQVYGLGVWRGSHRWPRMNFRSCVSRLSMQAVSWHAMTWWRSSGIATSLLMTILSVQNVARLRKKLEEAGLSNSSKPRKASVTGWPMNKFGTIFWQYVVSRRRLLYLLVIFFDHRFGLCLSLSRDRDGFLYATLVLGFFLPSVSWSGISPWPFGTIERPLVWGKEVACHWNTSFMKNTRKNSRRAWRKGRQPRQVQWPDGLLYPLGSPD